MNFVLDTNTAIYIHKAMIAEPLPLGRYYMSIISEIELLSYPHLTPSQEKAIEDLLADLSVITLTEDIKIESIQLRRRHRLKLPDAIIAATALVLDAELLSNDTQIKSVADLRCRPLSLKTM